MARQFIYHMQGLSKTYPGNRKVLPFLREYGGEMENRIFRDMQWVRPGELPSFDFLEADLKLVSDLSAGRLTL